MKQLTTFAGKERLSTQALLQEIYAALAAGETEFEIDASGQHDIGGPLWSDGRCLRFRVRNPGQRVGSMGLPGTEIIVEGPAPADIGWLNAGATIVVKGDGGDTAGHCAADGVIYIGGRAGTRSGSLMKHDPAYAPPQLWILKSTGSFSFEFMGGGIAVVCGCDCDGLESVLGDRACVGMVGGVIYVRGPVQGLSSSVKLVDELDDADWGFLAGGLPNFLTAIERTELLDVLLMRPEWRKVIARSQTEAKAHSRRRPLAEFHAERWIAGGLFGDVVADHGEIASLVPAGRYRVRVPMWRNKMYAAPCENACPVGIPSQERFNLLRQGKVREALELALQYTPFPGSVCGVACPAPCMEACTRNRIDEAVNIKQMGMLSAELAVPSRAPATGKRFAVIGGGVGGLSAAWHLALRGHAVTVFERGPAMGGKLTMSIPHERLSPELPQLEIERIGRLEVEMLTESEIDGETFADLYAAYDGIIIAVGAHAPRTLDFSGSDGTLPALTFLNSVNAGDPVVEVAGRAVVVIGAGDVGMDVCNTAWRLGAHSVTAVDIQAPAGSACERAVALALGTRIIWPRVTREYKDGRLFFVDGSSLPADVVIVAIGEIPETDWLPAVFERVKGRWLAVDATGRTADPKVFAIGDVVRPGLLAHAVGAARLAAQALHAQVMGLPFELRPRLSIPAEKLGLVYLPPRPAAGGQKAAFDASAEADRCVSCGTCRDCGICAAVCGSGAIMRRSCPDGSFEFVVDDERCSGCSFCATVCPSGVWTMVSNTLAVGALGGNGADKE